MTCWVLRYYILWFLTFCLKTANHFSKVKLSTSSALSNGKKLSIHLTSVIFYWTEKSVELSYFITQKVRMYLQYLSLIYVISYRYLLSVNRYNIIKQNIQNIIYFSPRHYDNALIKDLIWIPEEGCSCCYAWIVIKLAMKKSSIKSFRVFASRVP